MSDNNEYLSQEEIDALLNQSADADADEEKNAERSEPETSAPSLNVEDYLTSMEQDALGEIGNITFGSSATALSTLLGKKVDITTPKVSIVSKSELENQFPHPHVAVHVNYIDGFQGINLLVIRTEDAQVIADLMLGGDGTNTTEGLNEIHISAVQEAMNQMMGSAATSMSTLFNRLVNISPPGIDILNVSEEQGVDHLPEDEVLVTVSFRLKIEDLIDSYIMQMLTVPFSKEMVAGLLGGDNGSAEVKSPNTKQAETAKPDSPPTPASTNQDAPFTEDELNQLSDQLANPGWDQAAQPSQASQPMQPPQQPPMQSPLPPMQPGSYQVGQGGMQQNRNVNVQPVQYTNFAQDASTVGDMNLNLLMDIPLKVTVELGRTRKLIRDILEFTQGSIIELDKLAGEPVDILVNDKLIAKGEVVVIDENFGVRVTDIVSQQERMNKLQY